MTTSCNSGVRVTPRPRHSLMASPRAAMNGGQFALGSWLFRVQFQRSWPFGNIFMRCNMQGLGRLIAAGFGIESVPVDDVAYRT